MTGSQSPTLLAVIVLYQCELASSQSFSSLRRILTEDSALAEQIHIVLYDNSPLPQLVADPLEYVHDPSNGGLATAYNYALDRAEKESCTWLLLLDQDTSLTADFISELLITAKRLEDQQEVGMIVPKLAVNGIVHSPAIPFLAQMRRQFQPTEEPIGRDVSGLLQQRMDSYNSGSTLRVSALRAAGGFPLEFWLDFLDHAIFNALFAHGYRVYLLLATLEHEASYANIDQLPYWRMHSVLMSQTLYVKRNGNFTDRLLYRLWLLRSSRNLRRSCTNPRIWREAAMQALLFRSPKASR